MRTGESIGAEGAERIWGQWLEFVRGRVTYYERMERWGMGFAAALLLGAGGFSAAGILFVERISILNDFLETEGVFAKLGTLMAIIAVLGLVALAAYIRLQNRGIVAGAFLEASLRRQRLVGLEAFLLAARAKPGGGPGVFEVLDQAATIWARIEKMEGVNPWSDWDWT